MIKKKFGEAAKPGICFQCFYRLQLIKSLTCHIQATERFVQVLTNVARRAVDKNRDDIIAVTVKSRTAIPRMDSKKDLEKC